MNYLRYNSRFRYGHCNNGRIDTRNEKKNHVKRLQNLIAPFRNRCVRISAYRYREFVFDIAQRLFFGIHAANYH